MLRIAGVNLPEKRIVIALTYVMGVGNSMSKKILADCSIDPSKRPDDLTEEEQAVFYDLTRAARSVEAIYTELQP